MASGTKLSSGLKTNSALIATGRNIFAGIQPVSGGAAGGVITVHDGVDNTGAVLYKTTLAAGATGAEADHIDRVRATVGIYVDCSAADLDYIIYYGA